MKSYDKAFAEVVLFDNTDVIRTSGECPHGNSYRCNSGTGISGGTGEEHDTGNED